MPSIAAIRHVSLSVSSLALLAACPAFGAEIEAKSRVDAVIVYPDAASVSRVVDFEAPAGASTLVFHGLPNGLDPNSLRVEATAGGKLSIGAVETRLEAEPPRDSAIDAKLKKARGEREAWQGTIDALEAKKAMILRFSQSGPEKLSPESQPLDIAQWGAAWDTVGQGLAKISDEILAAKVRARDIDDEIKSLEQARQRPPGSRLTSRLATVSLDAEAAVSGKLTLTYRIAGAGWLPAYDAKLDTGAGAKPSLELVRRATVTQNTGEDWTGVALSVSTTRARGGAQAPDIYTQRVAFYEPPVPTPVAGAARNGPVPAPPPAAKLAAAPLDSMAPAAPVAAHEQQATLDAGAYQASFQIPGRVDIPGDGSAKNFRISTSTFTPDLIVKTAPAADPTAYLQARIVNGEDAPLLPGLVNVLRDGAFVGQSRLGLVAPGDSADVGFGADDRVKVTRAPVKRKENDPVWYGSTKTEQREFKTTVKNLHPFAAKVVVVDQIPVSENSAIVIEQLPNTTPPTDKTVNDRRGVMDWAFDLAPGAEKSLTLAYRMKWPADRDVVFETSPGGK